MAKTFFTNVSEKALEGIRNMYAETGSKVSAIYDQKTGEYTVVVMHPEKAPIAA
ncbi:hypothetical protein N6L26_09295 [Qipengyuania sp. SS22]|uniref:hypothetical protein n=1 Tax=Qipengyuania sp. SS22 TaxID=2979461 RepID=UPI0021E543D2|nr:hypothetical protein [Qipengyuania sp. SS22]UYH54248.1 hypothetical protein N6L26_09295 [Qipengyuania sp. SS22]